MDIAEEILDDPADGNIVDIQLVPFYKEKKKVEGTFKLGELDLIGCIVHSVGRKYSKSGGVTRRFSPN